VGNGLCGRGHPGEGRNDQQQEGGNVPHMRLVGASIDLCVDKNTPGLFQSTHFRI
jgi:hypothetical protein